MAPVRTVQVRAKYNPWLSEETKNLMKERDKAQKRAAATNDGEAWKKYKRLRNRINNRLKAEEKN